MSKKKFITIIAIIFVAILCISIKPIITYYYSQKYTNSLQPLLTNCISKYIYSANATAKKIMKEDRYILLEMKPEFNTLSREKKEDYLKYDLCEKLQTTFRDWRRDNRLSNNMFWNDDSLISDIRIEIDCNGKHYKYGFYETHEYKNNKGKTKTYSTYEEKFVDSDGKTYDLPDKNQQTSNNATGNSSNNNSQSYESNTDSNNKGYGNSSSKSDNYNDLKYSPVTSSAELGNVWAMAQSFVKDKLKSPSSAKFPVYSDSGVSITKAGNYYKVSGYVEAENSFGAKIKTTFYIVMEKSGSNYIQKECHIY